jgi:hypothetical protein
MTLPIDTVVLMDIDPAVLFKAADGPAHVPQVRQGVQHLHVDLRSAAIACDVCPDHPKLVQRPDDREDCHREPAARFTRARRARWIDHYRTAWNAQGRRRGRPGRTACTRISCGLLAADHADSGCRATR